MFSMRRLMRSRRWRRTFIVACLPYLLLSVLAQFHVHRVDGGMAAVLGVGSASAAPASVSPATARSARLPDGQCAICQWLRAGPRLQPRVSIDPSARLLADAVAIPPAQSPASPDLWSIALRGPPVLFS
jgi:hypothetical protein